ncbi:MAG: amidohydrolase [Acidobacteria bacterium]|nr:amidohydrolase [Acidobacteriota bacterium]
MVVIDCHAHIYSDDPAKYPVRTAPLRPPAGKGTVEHLRQESQAAGVAAVRAIQTVTYYGYDNSYLCDSAKAHPDWVCGVATLDPDDARSPGLLRQFVRESRVRSLRSIPSAKNKTFDDPGVRALWKVVADEGITADLFLMRPDMVPSASKLLAAFPRVTVGFCHCMDLKPGPELEANLKTVLRLSRFKNLYPKVDFIGTGTQLPYPCPDLHHACMEIIRTYGAERCLWGSCYPCELWTPKISYSEHLRLFSEALPLKEAERRQILGENARRIWFPKLVAFAGKSGTIGVNTLLNVSTP